MYMEGAPEGALANCMQSVLRLLMAWLFACGCRPRWWKRRGDGVAALLLSLLWRCYAGRGLEAQWAV